MGGMVATSSQRRIGTHHVSRSSSSLGKPFTISTVFRLAVTFPLKQVQLLRE